MRYLWLALAAISEGRVYVRQGSFNATSVVASTTTVSSSPASVASLPLASVTKASNTTSTAIPATTTAPSNTCCFIYPHGVGIGTWWTSSVDLTVATIVTTWLQYNNTLIPANSTTKTVVNATQIFGAHQMQTYEYSLSEVTPTATVTTSYCGGFDETSCTLTTPETITKFAYSTVYMNTSSILPGIPNSLLPSNAALYGKTSVDSTTMTTFSEQSLTIAAPTPFFVFSGINLHTSKECMATFETTDYTSWGMITTDGYASQVSSVYPTATVTDFKGSWPIIPGSSGDVHINATFGRAFPDGDYSNFNFTDWAQGVIMGVAPGSVDAYMFRLPEDFPEFLAGIPKIKSEYPDIASCTNFAGDGEPTVHVPVNQLTDTTHVTMTMKGALNPSAGSPKPEPDIKTTSDSPPKQTQAPVIATTEKELDTPSDGQTQTPIVAAPKPTLDVPTNAVEPQPIAVTEKTQDNLATPTQGVWTPKAPQIQNPDSILDTPQPEPQTTQHIGDIIASVIGLQQPEPVNEPAAGSAQPPLFTFVPQPLPGITEGGSVVTGNSDHEFVVGGQTLAPGGAAITAGGNTIEMPSQPTAVIVNGNPTPIVQPQAPANVPAPEWTFGENTITANAASEFVLASQTISPGGDAVTVAGTIFSLATGASAIVVNGQTSELVVPVGAPVTFGGAIATPIASGAYVLPDGATLQPGASGIVVAGTTYSLADGGSSIVVNGVESPVPATAGAMVGSLTGLILQGTTLSPGTEAVISGTIYSLPATGGGIYVNGQSSRLQAPRPGSPLTLPNGVVATPTVVAEIVIGSQTLAPGRSPITISGTTYSISGTEMIVAASASTRTVDLADVVSSLTATATTTSSSTESHTSPSTARSSASITTPSRTESALAVASSTDSGAPSKVRQQTSIVAFVVAMAFCML